MATELDAWMAGRRELLGRLGLLAAWDALRDLAAKQELRGRATEAPRRPATWQRVSACHGLELRWGGTKEVSLFARDYTTILTL